MSRTRYGFDTADPAERRRLEAHRALWDPFTCRVLETVGVAPGWRCLEIGAGTGSVAAWLVDRAGPTGQVVATDVETRWLEPLGDDTLVVRHHDVVRDPIDGGFDLVHARLVLEHLPPRRAVAAKLAAALRPGGWLVLEDYDVRTMRFAEPRLGVWEQANDFVVAALAARGHDATFGSALGPLLREIGLADVAVEGVVHHLPIPELAPVFRPPLAALGADPGAPKFVDDALATFDADDAPSSYTPVLVSARGRRRAPASART